MDILFLSETFPPHGSGAELATFLYADLLSKMGCNVVVVTNRFAGEPGSSTIGSFKIHRLPLLDNATATKYSILKRSDILISGFVRRMVKWSDVVYVPRFWFSAIPLAKAYRKPVVTHMHDYIPVCPLSTLYDKSKTNEHSCGRIRCNAQCIYAFEKTRGRGINETLASVALNLTVGRVLPRMVYLSDAVLCVSRVQRELIIGKERTLRDKAHILYNPVSKSADIDISGEDSGYFGGCDYLKGFYLLCRALAYRKAIGFGQKRIHATKLQSVGTNVRELLNTLGFLLYGKLDDADFRGVYRQIRTVLVPSLWNEPWPYVVVEALMQRRLLIASSIGGIPEQVEGCKGAFLCEPGDSKQLADTMELITGLNREEMNDLGSQNREVFLRRFNNDSSIRKFISICEHLT